MILKASQRSGGIALANHLMNDRDNDHVTLYSLRGFIADDLHGAMREAYAISRSTKCRQFLFSVSVNPPQHEAVSDTQLEDAVDRIEGKLNLNGFQRVIVFHEKEGRRHAHAVWSRIDLGKMRSINLPHFKRKLMDVSRELFIEHGWQMPRGLMKDGEPDPLNFTLEEWQQAKRAKVDPQTVKRDLQDCLTMSDSAQSFARALESRGYVLARGDQRGYVAVDWRGEVYAVARWTGQKTKNVRARLKTVDNLPSVEEARAQISDGFGARILELLKTQEEKRAAEEAAFAELKKKLLCRQRQERADLLNKQHAERTALAAARRARLPRGLKALWWYVTKKYHAVLIKFEQEANPLIERHAQERHVITEHQLKERRELQYSRRKDDRTNQALQKMVMQEIVQLKISRDQKLNFGDATLSNQSSNIESDAFIKKHCSRKTVKTRKPTRNR